MKVENFNLYAIILCRTMIKNWKIKFFLNDVCLKSVHTIMRTGNDFKLKKVLKCLRNLPFVGSYCQESM